MAGAAIPDVRQDPEKAMLKLQVNHHYHLQSMPWSVTGTGTACHNSLSTFLATFFVVWWHGADVSCIGWQSDACLTLWFASSKTALSMQWESIQLFEVLVWVIQEKLRLDMSDEDAVEWMQQLLNDSATALMPQITDRTHRWATYWLR